MEGEVTHQSEGCPLKETHTPNQNQPGVYLPSAKMNSV